MGLTSAQKRILCVEDHGDTCELIAILLRDYKVISAHSKAEALRLASGEHFDLFLLDYNLPDGTGIEICLYIRTFNKKTPILFSTAFDLLTELQVEAVGAQGIIRKGVTFSDELMAKANQFLRTAQQ